MEAGVGVLELDYSQYQTVYNILSFALASMLATTVFLLAVQGRVLPRYRQALVVSAMVCLIAAYHYYRIFDSFRHSYVAVDEGSAATAMNAMSYMLVNGEGFNEGYRYVDWLLTVPLLLFEAIAVLALPRAVRKSLLMKLIPASALMIILGYPGEIAVGTRIQISEDNHEELAGLPDDDPRSGLFHVYDWLTFLQESLVRCMDPALYGFSDDEVPMAEDEE